MTVLAGQEAEGAGTAIALNLEIGAAWLVEATASGEVTELHATLTAGASATGCRIALQEAGTKPKTGVLAEGEIPATTGAHGVAVTGVNVTKGTKYFLTLAAVGGIAKIKPGSTTQVWKTGTSKKPKISEFTEAQWTVESTQGPAAIWATGTESGGTEVKEIAGKSKLTLTAKAAPAQTQALTAKSVLLLGGKLQATQIQAAAAKSVLTFSSKAAAQTVAELAGSSKLTLVAHATPALIAEIQATSKLRFVGHAKVTATGGESRRVAIFVFDD